VACSARAGGRYPPVKGVKRLGQQVGNWLTVEEGQQLVGAVPIDTLRGKRDAAMLGLLLGCGLRRSEVPTADRKDSTRTDTGDCRPDRQSRSRANGADAALGQERNRQLDLHCQH